MKPILIIAIFGSVLLVIGMIINIVTSLDDPDTNRSNSLKAASALIGIGWLVLIGIIVWEYHEFVTGNACLGKLTDQAKKLSDQAKALQALGGDIGGKN